MSSARAVHTIALSERRARRQRPRPRPAPPVPRRRPAPIAAGSALQMTAERGMDAFAAPPICIPRRRRAMPSITISRTGRTVAKVHAPLLPADALRARVRGGAFRRRSATPRSASTCAISMSVAGDAKRRRAAIGGVAPEQLPQAWIAEIPAERAPHRCIGPQAAIIGEAARTPMRQPSVSGSALVLRRNGAIQRVEQSLGLARGRHGSPVRRPRRRIRRWPLRSPSGRRTGRADRSSVAVPRRMAGENGCGPHRQMIAKRRAACAAKMSSNTSAQGEHGRATIHVHRHQRSPRARNLPPGAAAIASNSGHVAAGARRAGRRWSSPPIPATDDNHAALSTFAPPASIDDQGIMCPDDLDT